jgi:hypothetical protein
MLEQGHLNVSEYKSCKLLYVINDGFEAVVTTSLVLNKLKKSRTKNEPISIQRKK